jgi:hypothetical protein
LYIENEMYEMFQDSIMGQRGIFLQIIYINQITILSIEKNW